METLSGGNEQPVWKPYRPREDEPEGNLQEEALRIPSSGEVPWGDQMEDESVKLERLEVAPAPVRSGIHSTSFPTDNRREERTATARSSHLPTVVSTEDDVCAESCVGYGDCWFDPCSPYATLDSCGLNSWTRQSRFWIDGDYLLWWMEGGWVPVLVTSGTPASAGVLGNPETTVLFGGARINNDVRSGGRFSGGFWLDACQEFGIEGDYLTLENRAERFVASSSGNPMLARPFFNIVGGVEDSHVIAFPGFAAGSVSVRGDSRFQSAGAVFRQLLLHENILGWNGIEEGRRRVDLLVGYRFCRLDEDLSIAESFEAAGPTVIEVSDLFDARTQFHGGEFGVRAEFVRWEWSLEVLVKVALGNSRSTVLIDGATSTSTGGGAPVTVDGGVLALSTNRGRYVKDEFAVVPEVGVSVGYNFTDHMRATFGYTFIYWNRVARPGGQVDRVVNPSYLPNNGPPAGASRPAFSFASTDMWLQGMNFGIEYRF